MHHDTSWAWALLLGLAGCSATAAPAVLQFALCSTLGMTPAGEPGPKGAPGTNGGPSGAAPRALHNSVTGDERAVRHDGHVELFLVGAPALEDRAPTQRSASSRGSEFDLPNNCVQQSGCGSDDDLTHENDATAYALPARRADDVFQSAPTSAHRSDPRALAEAGAQPANRSAKGAAFFVCSTASPISRRDSLVGVHAGLICRLPNSPLYEIDFAVSRAGIDEGIDASADELSGEAGAHTANDDHSGGTPAPRSGSSTADAGWRRRRAGCSGHGRAGGRGGADGRAPPAQRA